MPARAARRSRPTRLRAGRISAIGLLPRVTMTDSPASIASSRSENRLDASVALIVLMRSIYLIFRLGARSFEARRHGAGEAGPFDLCHRLAATGVTDVPFRLRLQPVRTQRCARTMSQVATIRSSPARGYAGRTRYAGSPCHCPRLRSSGPWQQRLPGSPESGQAPPPRRPTRVVALGDTSVVTEGMLAAAAAATPERDQAEAVATAGGCVAEVDGTIRCVEPDRGRLPGAGTPVGRGPLVPVGVAPDPVADMTARVNDVCARTQAGAVVCTTVIRDEAGERRTGLVTPPGLERGVSAIRVTRQAVFAVTREGRLMRAPRGERAWGAAQPLPEAGDDVRKVASDDTITCVLTGDAAVRCWGIWSELPRSVAGNEPSPRPSHGPTLVPGLPSGITDIDLHFSGLRVRTTDGRVHLVTNDGLTHPARDATSVARSGCGRAVACRAAYRRWTTRPGCGAVWPNPITEHRHPCDPTGRLTPRSRGGTHAEEPSRTRNTSGEWKRRPYARSSIGAMMPRSRRESMSLLAP